MEGMDAALRLAITHFSSGPLNSTTVVCKLIAVFLPEHVESGVVYISGGLQRLDWETKSIEFSKLSVDLPNQESAAHLGQKLTFSLAEVTSSTTDWRLQLCISTPRDNRVHGFLNFSLSTVLKNGVAGGWHRLTKPHGSTPKLLLQEQENLLDDIVDSDISGSFGSAENPSQRFSTWRADNGVTKGQISDEEMDRQEAIHELIKTEERYLQDLKMVLDTFSWETCSSVMSLEHYQAIIGSLAPLRDLCSTIVNALLACRDPYTGKVEKIGHVILKYLPHISGVYNAYCARDRQASSLLAELQAENRGLADLLKKCQKKCRNLDLHSFRLSPMQRVTRYPLLLQEINRRCPIDHPDKLDIEKSIKVAEELAKEVNEAVRYVENLSHKDDLAKNLKLPTNISSFGFPDLRESNFVLLRIATFQLKVKEKRRSSMRRKSKKNPENQIRIGVIQAQDTGLGFLIMAQLQNDHSYLALYPAIPIETVNVKLIPSTMKEIEFDFLTPWSWEEQESKSLLLRYRNPGEWVDCITELKQEIADRHLSHSTLQEIADTIKDLKGRLDPLTPTEKKLLRASYMVQSLVKQTRELEERHILDRERERKVISTLMARNSIDAGTTLFQKRSSSTSARSVSSHHLAVASEPLAGPQVSNTASHRNSSASFGSAKSGPALSSHSKSSLEIQQHGGKARLPRRSVIQRRRSVSQPFRAMVKAGAQTELSNNVRISRRSSGAEIEKVIWEVSAPEEDQPAMKTSADNPPTKVDELSPEQPQRPKPGRPISLLRTGINVKGLKKVSTMVTSNGESGDMLASTRTSPLAPISEDNSSDQQPKEITRNVPAIEFDNSIKTNECETKTATCDSGEVEAIRRNSTKANDTTAAGLPRDSVSSNCSSGYSYISISPTMSAHQLSACSSTMELNSYNSTPLIAVSPSAFKKDASNATTKNQESEIVCNRDRTEVEEAQAEDNDVKDENKQHVDGKTPGTCHADHKSDIPSPDIEPSSSQQTQNESGEPRVESGCTTNNAALIETQECNETRNGIEDCQAAENPEPKDQHDCVPASLTDLQDRVVQERNSNKKDEEDQQERGVQESDSNCKDEEDQPKAVEMPDVLDEAQESIDGSVHEKEQCKTGEVAIGIALQNKSDDSESSAIESSLGNKRESNESIHAQVLSNNSQRASAVLVEKQITREDGAEADDTLVNDIVETTKEKEDCSEQLEDDSNQPEPTTNLSNCSVAPTELQESNASQINTQDEQPVIKEANQGQTDASDECIANSSASEAGNECQEVNKFQTEESLVVGDGSEQDVSGIIPDTTQEASEECTEEEPSSNDEQIYVCSKDREIAPHPQQEDSSEQSEDNSQDNNTPATNLSTSKGSDSRGSVDQVEEAKKTIALLVGENAEPSTDSTDPSDPRQTSTIITRVKTANELWAEAAKLDTNSTLDTTDYQSRRDTWLPPSEKSCISLAESLEGFEIPDGSSCKSISNTSSNYSLAESIDGIKTSTSKTKLVRSPSGRVVPDTELRATVRRKSLIPSPIKARKSLSCRKDFSAEEFAKRTKKQSKNSLLQSPQLRRFSALPVSGKKGLNPASTSTKSTSDSQNANPRAADRKSAARRSVKSKRGRTQKANGPKSH